MTSPPESIKIKCPGCGNVYEDWHRASVNQMMDDFDDNYPDESSRAHCPEFRYTIEFDTLVVDKEGTFILPED